MHCQQHVHWSLDGCMPLPDGVHRSIGSSYPNYLTTLYYPKLVKIILSGFKFYLGYLKLGYPM